MRTLGAAGVGGLFGGLAGLVLGAAWGYAAGRHEVDPFDQRGRHAR
jgi:hypothetical protein